MAQEQCKTLLREAVDAFKASDLDVMLERAVAASRCASPRMEAETLFWVAMAHDALGEHTEAERIWRQVRDHPAADASQPLLPLRAAYNMNRRRDRTSDEAVSERHALALELAKRLGYAPDRTFAELLDLAVFHLHTLMGFYEYGEVLPLADAILASQHGEDASISAERLWETRRCDLVAKLGLRAADDAQQRFDEIAGGDEVALKVVKDWAARLKQGGDRADGQLVLLAAWLQLLILGNLGRLEEAESVLAEAEATRAAHDPTYAPILAGMREVLS